MPCSTPAPSNAGPAEQAHVTSQSALPSTVSPFVPTSMNSVRSAVSSICALRTPALMSAPDIAGDTRQAVHNRLWVGDQPQLPGGQTRHVVDDGDVGRQPDGIGRDRQQQMDHGGVAGDRQLEHLFRRSADVPARGFQQPIDRADHQLLHLDQSFVPFGVDDAGDHILATGDLTIVVRGLRHHLAALQVHQPYGDGGCADVHGRAEVAIGAVAGQDGQQLGWTVGLIPAIQRDDCRHLPRRRPGIPNVMQSEASRRIDGQAGRLTAAASFAADTAEMPVPLSSPRNTLGMPRTTSSETCGRGTPSVANARVMRAQSSV